MSLLDVFADPNIGRIALLWILAMGSGLTLILKSRRVGRPSPQS